MKLLKMSTMAAFACLLMNSAYAQESDLTKPKRQLKNNMTEVYNTLPDSVKNFTDALVKGELYGRLRMNSFKWNWKNETSPLATNGSNKALGLGGSLIYKTAPLYGVSGTVGLYYSDSPFEGLRDPRDDISYIKAGKDTISRYQVNKSGNYSMAVLAQAYLQYDISKTTFKGGRQIFESVLTRSNDTKMIPNTFEGYSVETKEIPKTRLRAAYFYAQKLRDHTTFHDVITFGDGSIKTDTNNPNWNNNDDGAVHKGLSYANFEAAGEATNHALIVADLRNRSIKDIQLDMTYTAVPDVVSSLIGEVNYKIAFGRGFSLTPGVRYMYQMDDGGGEIGGAALSGLLASWKTGESKLGYADPKSLDSSLWMARLVLRKGALKVQAGYSAVADEADIVAPWRGFPTGGYTRAMGQYNWRANTKTSAAEVYYDFDKAKLLSGLSILLRYAMQDFDKAKQEAGVQADSNIIHIDIREQLRAVPGLDAKIRIGLVSADERDVAAGKADVDSYNEYRFEINYLF